MNLQVARRLVYDDAARPGSSRRWQRSLFSVVARLTRSTRDLEPQGHGPEFFRGDRFFRAALWIPDYAVTLSSPIPDLPIGIAHFSERIFLGRTTVLII